MVAPHNLAMLPVLGGISGSTRTMLNGFIRVHINWEDGSDGEHNQQEFMLVYKCIPNSV